MKKLILIFSLLIISLFAGFAQILPNWTWARAITGQQGGQVQQVLMDNDGNIYVSGYIEYNGGPLSIDGSVFSTDTNQNVFVAKFNPAGNLLWQASVMMKDPQIPTYLNAQSIMLDKMNNLYFTVGSTPNQYITDSTLVVLNYKGQQKDFALVAMAYYTQPGAIIKFDADGNLKYITSLIGYGYSAGKGKGGNNTTLIKGVPQDKTGRKGFGSRTNLWINSSVADAQGNLYLAGQYALDSLILGSSIHIPGDPNNGNSFIAKIDTAGNFVWATIDSTSSPNYLGSEAMSIILDAAGNPLVFGDFGTVDRKFGNFIIDLVANSSSNLYIVSLDSKDGSPISINSFGGDNTDYANSIISDSKGNYFVTGFTSSSSLFGQSGSGTGYYDSYIASIDPALNVNWAKILYTGINSLSSSNLKLVVGKDNYPILTGLFVSMSLNLDKFTVQNLTSDAGLADYFMARFDSLGNATYLNSFGTLSDDQDFNVYSNSHNILTLITGLNNTDNIFYIGGDTVNYVAPAINLAYIDTAGKLIGQSLLPYTGTLSDISSQYFAQSSSGYLGVAGGFSGTEFDLGNNILVGIPLYNNLFVSKIGYIMSGSVMDQLSQAVNSGFVKLYMLTQSGPSKLMDSVQLDASGNYKFTEAPLTGSIIFAVADTNKYPNYAGTYSGNSMLWTSATILDLGSTPSSAFNIMLKQILPLTGPGIISGTVSQTLDTTSISTKGLKSTGRPMKGASVVLIGKSTKGADTIIAITYTDNNGFYQFTKIPVGDYKVWIDVTGLGMLEYYAVSISDVSPEVANADYIVSKDGIFKDLSSGIRSIQKQNPGLAIYPNPAADFMHALIPGNTAGHIEIYNVSGLLMKSITLDAGRSADIIIGTSELSPGMYLLKASLTGKPALYGHFMKL